MKRENEPITITFRREVLEDIMDVLIDVESLWSQYPDDMDAIVIAINDDDDEDEQP